MLEYDRIDISEGIDVNKLFNSRECSFFHFYYSLDKNFRYQRYFYDGCYDMSMKAVSINNLAIAYSRENAYRTIFAFMTLNEASNLIKNSSNLNNKRGVL